MYEKFLSLRPKTLSWYPPPLTYVKHFSANGYTKIFWTKNFLRRHISSQKDTLLNFSKTLRHLFYQKIKTWSYQFLSEKPRCFRKNGHPGTFWILRVAPNWAISSFFRIEAAAHKLIWVVLRILFGGDLYVYNYNSKIQKWVLVALTWITVNNFVSDSNYSENRCLEKESKS